MAKQVNKLTSIELYALGKKLEERTFVAGDTLDSLAKEFSTEDRQLTRDNMRGLLQMVGKTIPRTTEPVPVEKQIRVLASCIHGLYVNLGIAVPKALEDLL